MNSEHNHPLTKKTMSQEIKSKLRSIKNI